MLKLCLIVLFWILGCVHFEGDFSSTFNKINHAKSVCGQHINNVLVAQKECFPLLTDTLIKMKLYSIDQNFNQITLRGAAGMDRSRIWCYPSKDQLKEILKDPSAFPVQKNYFIKGKFTSVSLGGTLDFYSFDECELDPVKESD